MNKLPKIAALNRNVETGMAVFSGPKGHILLVLDTKVGWEQVKFTDDDEFAYQFLHGN